MCFWLVWGGSISWLRSGDPHPESPHSPGVPVLGGPISEGPHAPGCPHVPGVPTLGSDLCCPCTARAGPCGGEAQPPKMALSGQAAAPCHGGSGGNVILVLVLSRLWELDFS